LEVNITSIDDVGDVDGGVDVDITYQTILQDHSPSNMDSMDSKFKELKVSIPPVVTFTPPPCHHPHN
jgi:hypothetical protein